MEVEQESHSFAHEDDDTGLDESLDQTGFLLQRLQELQAWQQEQEIQLLREQEQQIGRLVSSNNQSNRNYSPSEHTEEEDDTIGQDLSSLTSLEEYPRDAPVRNEICRSVTPRSDVTGALDNSSLPSWASREDISFPSKGNKKLAPSDERSKKLAPSSEDGRKASSRFLEDRPIIASKKNFDELLAEHLGQVDEQVEQPRQAAPAEEDSPTKKTFLRKGSGLARFGGVGLAPKRMKRSSSQVLTRTNGRAEGMKSLSGSCPKMNIPDKETIAFASKKTATKLTKTLTPGKTTATARALPSTARPPSILKLVSTTTPSPGILRKKELPPISSASSIKNPKRKHTTSSQSSSGNGSSGSSTTGNGNGLYDSVELSFIEKLAKADTCHRKDLEDLKTFEMLEEAACDSSFCSSSSTVKRLIQHTQMPSPISKPSLSMESLTSTPISNGKTVSRRSLEPPTFNGYLKSDIQSFLDRNRSDSNDNQNHNNSNDGDNKTLSDNDDTIVDDEEDNNSLTIESYPVQSDKPSILNGSVSDDNEDIYDRSWSDYDGPVESQQNGPRKGKNRVRFNDGRKEDDDNDDDNPNQDQEEMAFSPPRVPKNSASYLIWSIFSKERENRRKESEKKKKMSDKQTNGRNGGKSAPPSMTSSDLFSPLSKAKLTHPKSEYEFHTTLLNAKLTELEKEIAHFKSENEKLSTAKRKLQADRKSLAENVRAFETSKESEKKKLEEERKWVRREKSLFEKSQKDKKTNFERRAQDEVEELQNKLSQLNEDLQRKETKWAAVVTKLQEQVKLLEKENQHLHQENHKLKLRGVSSKISTHLIDPLNTAKRLAASGSGLEPSNGTPDSGFRSQDNLNDVGNVRSRNRQASGQTSLKSCIYNALCDSSDTESRSTGAGTTPTASSSSHTNAIVTPRMSFSPADSLDSNVTLVSASTNPATQKTTTPLAVPDQDYGTSSNGTLTPKDSQTRRAKAGQNGQTSPKESVSSKSQAVVQSVVRNEVKGTTEKIYSDGSVEICYLNGNRKEISPDGQTTKVYYYNGDIKETLPSGLVKYFYSQSKTWHLTYADGKEVLQFFDGQEEVRYPNGSLQISFSNGSVKKISCDGSEKIDFPDGTQVNISPNGDRTLILPNGHKEIHTSNLKRREYPDGTVKILYDDGRQETRYSYGRVRIKDRDGKLLHDSHPDK